MKITISDDTGEQVATVDIEDPQQMTTLYGLITSELDWLHAVLEDTQPGLGQSKEYILLLELCSALEKVLVKEGHISITIMHAPTTMIPKC